mmetsp:Transcript_23883/g.53162  ORF Transcript_23883/g.53162 Transcript_23883/m.53162 type:complete len:82 (-) Transcript_23883:2582-2827(-)
MNHSTKLGTCNLIALLNFSETGVSKNNSKGNIELRAIPKSGNFELFVQENREPEFILRREEEKIPGNCKHQQNLTDDNAFI